MAFEENEISIKSVGGTELVKRGLAERIKDEIDLDQFQVICSRVREIDESKIRVLWLHDLPEDPESKKLKDPSFREQFHKIVFCSQWQYQRYQQVLGIPYDERCVVIENGIEPITPTEKSKDKIKLVYSSTPQRGLAILVPVFEELAKRYDNIELNVFSSYKIYGWDEADQRFESLFDKCREHPNIVYHGFKPNSEVRACLQESHIHSYPSIWQETSCLSVIEAMSAGLLCVHPNFAALTDTSGGLNFVYQGNSDLNKHAKQFYQALSHAIEVVNTPEVQTYIKLVKTYADSRFHWTKIKSQWVDLLKGLELQYKDVDSRKIPKQQFVYRVE